MAIKSSCDCGYTFSAKDHLAGKRVKCPKCQQIITIPKLAPSAQPHVAATPAGGQIGSFNPLLDLLEEAGVKSAPAGPLCPACNHEMSPTAVICVNCGYNIATGETLETYSDHPQDEIVDVEDTDAEERMRKAEREIEEMPVGAEDQDFGDGSDSVVVAVGAALGMGLLAVIGVSVIFFMDNFGGNPANVSFVASSIIVSACVAWLTYIAFMVKPMHGLICIFTAGIYCILFGFTQGKTVFVTILLLFALVIGIVSFVFSGELDEESVRAIDNLMMRRV